MLRWIGTYGLIIINMPTDVENAASSISLRVANVTMAAAAGCVTATLLQLLLVTRSPKKANVAKMGSVPYARIATTNSKINESRVWSALHRRSLRQSYAVVSASANCPSIKQISRNETQQVDGALVFYANLVITEIATSAEHWIKSTQKKRQTDVATRAIRRLTSSCSTTIMRRTNFAAGLAIAAIGNWHCPIQQ